MEIISHRAVNKHVGKGSLSKSQEKRGKNEKNTGISQKKLF